MERKILVTGGAGYVGCRLVPALLSNGYGVRVLDNMIYGDEGLSALRNDAEIVRGDIRDQAAVEKSLSGIDSVIHLACISNDPSSDLNPLLTKQINYDGHALLVDAAKKEGVNRFIFASSSSVYGIKEEEKVTEDLSLEPLTMYSSSKVFGEKYLLSIDSPDFTTVVIRPATICGYSPRQRFDVVVNIFTYSGIKDGVINVNGGSQKRPNIHIADMVEAYLGLLEADREKISGKVYNFGGENHTLLQLAEITRDTLKSVKAKIEVKPSTKDSRSYSISSDKIRDELGIEPKRGIGDAVSELEEALIWGVIPEPESSRYRNVLRIKEIGAETLLLNQK